MSSPITKLRQFSKLFSPSSVSSPQRCAKESINSPKLDSSCSPGLPSLPQDHERPVETPSSNRKPALCSTPASKFDNSSRFCKALVENNHNQESSLLQSWCADLERLKRKRVKSNFATAAIFSRNRRFGVSDLPPLSRFKDKDERTGKTRRQSSKGRKCNVFSATVVPSFAPRDRTSILRLSGITLSPTSVSWVAQSPFSPVFNSDVKSKSISSPNSFYYSFDRTCKTMDHFELCPPEKLYYWMENEDEIITEEHIGKGGFGQVFKGTYKGERVAIKKLMQVFKSRQVFIETFQGEILALRLRHPNIVRTYVVLQSSPQGGAKTPGSCYVVMEHAGERNLSQIILDGDQLIDSARRNRYCVDMLHGLMYLHENGLAHLDLKPSNVVVTSHGLCKICDFGSCLQVKTPQSKPREVKESSCQCVTTPYDSAIGSSLFSAKMSSSTNRSGSQLMGTFQYRAPELLRGFLPTVLADIYSFAITAWQIWSRVPPYAGQHYHTAVYRVVALGLRPSIPDRRSDKLSTDSETHQSCFAFFDLLTSCWQADPYLRPSAKQAIATMKSWKEAY